jgi:hypothetical protein
MKGITKYSFMISYTIFFLLVQFIFVQMGQSGLLNVDSNKFVITSNCEVSAWLLFAPLGCLVNIVQIFITLFTISSSFTALQTLFVIPFGVFMIMIVADYIRGTG